MLRKTFAASLTRSGYDVIALDCATEACRLLSSPEGRFDVVVSDISLPDQTGVDVLMAARRFQPETPVILMTGGPAVDTAMQAVEHGAFRYLVKPLSLSQLIEVVDQALRVRPQSPTQQVAAQARLTALGEKLTSALAQLWMAFQPIVDWQNKEIYAYEALLRSLDSEMGRPDHMLAAAEELGRLPELGRRIRAAVAKTIGELPTDAQVFVNLHAADLEDEELYDPSAPLSQHAAQVVLEITERASLSGTTDLKAAIARLRALGYRIAVDDLGAGYAGLTALAQIAPDVVKLDMSLVRNVDQEPIKRELVRSMTSLTQHLGIAVVAEGIETQAERDTVTGLGCSLLQGYLFAKPGPAYPMVVL